MGIRTRKSQRSRVKRRMPPPSAPNTSASGRFKSAPYRVSSASASVPTTQIAALLQHREGSHQIGHARDRHEFGGACRDFAYHPVDRGGTILRDDDHVHAGRIGRTQAGSQIVRVGDPVEHQQQADLRDLT